jgi:uncharacterized protein
LFDYILLKTNYLPVPNPRYPLRINVGFLLHQPVGSNRDIHFDYTDVRLTVDFQVSKLEGITRFNRTPQGLLVEADFSAYQTEECVRCLEPFELELRTLYQELFSFEHHPTAEPYLVIPEDGNIDLAPLTRDYLLLEKPIKALCKPDCKGLCTVCGEDLNVHTCAHQSRVVVK